MRLEYLTRHIPKNQAFPVPQFCESELVFICTFVIEDICALPYPDNKNPTPQKDKNVLNAIGYIKVVFIV